MIHYLTEKIDKKLQMEAIKRVTEAFLLSHPEIGFTKVFSFAIISSGTHPNYSIPLMLLF
jgi:hypothetical protein